MENIDFTQLIKWATENPDLSLIPIALLIGRCVKQSNISNAYIPVIVVALSTMVGFLIAGLDALAITKGFIAGMMAVAGHTGVTQITRKNSADVNIKDPSTQDPNVSASTPDATRRVWDKQ